MIMKTFYRFPPQPVNPLTHLNIPERDKFQRADGFVNFYFNDCNARSDLIAFDRINPLLTNALECIVFGYEVRRVSCLTGFKLLSLRNIKYKKLSKIAYYCQVRLLQTMTSNAFHRLNSLHNLSLFFARLYALLHSRAESGPRVQIALFL
jgi:hypothetical protein